jgi:hypothetical protein
MVSDDAIYFKAKDIATALDYQNTRQAIRANVDTEDRIILGNKKTVYINESGVYSLILRSDKEEARKFKSWLTSEVLPKLRKTGKYSINNNILELPNERSLHYRIVQYLKKYYPDVVVIPGLGENQDTSEKRIDSKLKGYSSGQSDLIIAVPNDHYSSFAIELKNPTGCGKLTEKQKNYLNRLQMFNYKTLVSSDYDEIIREVIEYMRTIKYACPFCKNNKYSNVFKNKEAFDNHIRYMHNINPSSCEKIDKITYKREPFNDEYKYFLKDKDLYTIQYETTHKYYIKKS